MLIGLCTRLDNWLSGETSAESERAVRNSGGVFSKRGASVDSSATVPVPEDLSSEPMQLGRSNLTPSDRQHRRTAGLCLYCGHAGHFLADCPVRPRLSSTRAGVLASGSSSCSSPARLTLSGMLFWGQESVSVSLLVDSGADDNFISLDLARQAHLPVEPLPEPRMILGLDGEVLAKITHRTQTITPIVSGNHWEQIQFYLIRSSSSPGVLGAPRLARHNPLIDWSAKRLVNWSVACHSSCLRAAVTPSSVVPFPAQETPDLSRLPKEYHCLGEVVSKQHALSLPPHRPYDCAIDLLPGAALPSSCFYNLSRAEREAMESYIGDSLASGLIQPSSSPVGAGFFFIQKKDGTLRPCIDYRALNEITVKNKYPLPLLDAAFAPLHRAQIFSKLDLRNAYYLVRIREGDEWKTFNTPLGHFEYLVMPFTPTNTPAMFQSLVNDILWDMLSKFLFVYLDDILIFFFPPRV